MDRIIINHASEAEWLAARHQDITSTEAAALFNAGVYTKTFYELWALKSGTIQPDAFEQNDRIKWGNRLESVIAQGIAEDLGLIVEPMKYYMRIPSLRIGSSFDFKITGISDDYCGDETYRDLFRQHGEGVLEVKNVDGLQFRRTWLAEDELIEAPVHIEFQVQHQLEVSGMAWAVIAPLVGGNTPKPIFRLRDRAVGDAILQQAASLWHHIDTGVAPQPDFTKDGDTISKVYRDNDGSAIDLSDDFRLGQLCRAYKKAGEAEKAAKAEKDAARAEIMTIIKAAKSIAAPGFKISAGTNKESYRAFWRDESERISITLSKIPGCQVEATVPAFRNVRISEV